MQRHIRSTVLGAVLASLFAAPTFLAGPEALAAPGDAETAAAAVLNGMDSMNSIKDPAKQQEAFAKFKETCEAFIKEWDGKVTSGPAMMALGLAYMVTGNSDKGQEICDNFQKGLEGKPAPSLKVSQVVGEKGAWDLSQAKGKVVLVDFWATWCGPCRAIIPDVIKLSEEHGKAGLTVVGATQLYGYGWLKGEVKKDLDEKAEIQLNADFKADMKIPYPIVLCEKNAAMMNYGVMGIPTVVLIDRKGIVRHVQVGGGDHEALVAKIKELLAEA